MSRLSEEIKARIRQLADEGAKQQYIAETVGCSRSTVAYVLEKSPRNHSSHKGGLPETQLNWTWADWKRYWAEHTGRKSGCSTEVTI